ncbi:MAG: adenine methylase [Candidatus Poribacteria bacterium]|nr:adenine methylase [Euryarchaeota archaeon]MDQ1327015.1 adenine methylase [Candidatus Poribacteria bacterium]
MIKQNHSPFRYPGGKFYARKIILECIPEHEKYCEPFAGGGSIFFSKDKVKYNILNDLDKELINCYRQIRDNVEDLINLLDGIEATKELHHYYKNEYTPQNDLERAFRWFYLNRTSYSGIMKINNCYWGYGIKYSMRPENWPNHLRTVSQRLKNVELYNYDFEELLNKIEKGFFLFIDPPYYNARQNDFYQAAFTREDHFRLSEFLRKNNNKFTFLLTYDNSSEVRELYSWCHSITDKEWNYTLFRTDDQKNGKKLEDGHVGKRYKGREVFITNYDPNSIKGLPEFKFNKKQLAFGFSEEQIA